MRGPFALKAISAALLACCLLASRGHAQTTLEFDQKSGLFKIHHNTVEVITADFAFWYDQWKWTGINVKGAITGPRRYRLSGESKATGLILTGHAASPASNELTWTLATTRTQARDIKEWGGISFHLALERLTADAFNPVPRLLPGNAGWELNLDPASPPLQVRFDPAIASVRFERGSPREIRAYFSEPPDRTAPLQLKMTVTLPKGGTVEPTLEERVAAPDASWYRNLTFWNRSPVDLSFLNEPERPAGKHGFLRADAGRLIFEDGQPVRFWGTNLTAYALFRTGFDDARQQARRLSQLGFNLVRIHHHDSRWVTPNIFGNKAASTLSLDRRSLSSLDWWIRCLNEEGIYVWLDLHVGREFTPEDGIDYFAEIAKGKPTAWPMGFSYINETIKLRMQQFAEAYLNHVNEHTGVKYKDNPGIAFLLLTNENDLTHHFGNALLPDKNVPTHNAIYMREARSFAQRHGLDPRQTWKSWTHGPAKLFLNDLEHRFNAEMIGHLRKLGVRNLIATTQSWGAMSMASLPSLTDGDVVDMHVYEESNFLQTDPRYQSNLVHWMAAASVLGKPLTVTEWNVSPFLAVDHSAVPVYVASVAALQDWSALMQFAYAQGPLSGPRKPGNWETALDPVTLAMTPVAALLFRQGHVAKGAQSYLLAPTAAELMGRRLSPETSRAIRTLTERSRLRVALPAIKELPWLTPADPQGTAAIVKDLDADFIADGAAPLLCADTGDFCRNWRDGIFVVDTDRSQIASGWIGGRRVETSNAEFEIKTANATVAVQSLDGQPIENSARILLSMAAQSAPEPQSGDGVLSEPVEGVLKVKAGVGLRAFSLRGDGVKRPLATAFADGVYTFTLDRKLESYWIMLERAAATVQGAEPERR